MKARLCKRFRFEAAHLLPNVPSGHKCGRLHGHSYGVSVVVEGEVDPSTGWVVDFDSMETIVDPVIEALDHRYLNEVEGLDNPTAEHIARWIWKRLELKLPLVEIQVDETPDAVCIFRGE